MLHINLCYIPKKNEKYKSDLIIYEIEKRDEHD